MIEFFLSKFWALLSALAILGVVTTCLNVTVQVATEQGREESFQGLIEVIEGPHSDGRGHIEIPLNDILLEGERLILGPGEIELVSEDHHLIHALPLWVKVLAHDKSDTLCENGTILGLGSVLCIDIAQGSEGEIISVYPRTP